MYDTVDIEEGNRSFLYISTYNEEDYVRFSGLPYEKYSYYSTGSPDDLLDALDNQYSAKEKHPILKVYKADAKDGIGRLVYDVPSKRLYLSYHFYDDRVYLYEMRHRKQSSKEEARWMDYYINVLYRGCSFTRKVGKMYTYEEYLKEQ